MYPDEKFPNYGVFVKNTETILEEADFKVSHLVMYKKKLKISKIISYLRHYFLIIYKCLVYNYDYIYVHYATHNSIPLLIVKKLKKNLTIITNVHGSDVIPETKIHNILQRPVQSLLKNSYKIITPSNYFKQIVSEKYGVSNQIEVFPSGGINEEVFYRISDKEYLYDKYKLESDIRYIGFVGRIDFGKGWDVLIKAVHLLNIENSLVDKKIIIVGDGIKSKELDQLISEYNLEDKVIRFNMLRQSQLNEIYNLMEVFCFPTLREGESLGLVGIEAMASGTPVIGSEIGGLLDYIIDGKNGLLFKPGDTIELKNKIISFFNYSQEKRELLGAESIVTANRYSKGELTLVIKKIFQEKRG
ncbi:glycosyltransferase family 4 protein [Peribacillus phoenicis]